MNGSPEQVQGLINELQSYSKVPLLVRADIVTQVEMELWKE